MQPIKTLAVLGSAVNQWFKKEYKVCLTATGVAVFVTLLRLLGFLQSMELAALDQMFRQRPAEPIDERVVIISINDADINYLQTWPIPDRVMADLLRKVRSYQPRAIGLDIYRDVPVGSGHADLQQVFWKTRNLIGIEKIAGDTHQGGESSGVKPPPVLGQRNQVGFNNVVPDDDSKVRRAFLYLMIDGKPRLSFALQLALLYLQGEQIRPTSASTDPRYLQLGKGIFYRLYSNNGGYVGADIHGYQILANLRSPASPFRTISLTDVLQNRVPREWIHNRVVLIGSTAISLKDFFYTSYSGGIDGNAQRVSGVELQANFVSQILSTALDGRSVIRVTPKPLEWIWIFAWSWVGAYLSWTLRSPLRSGLSIVIASGTVLSTCYLAFLIGWWVPLVPPIMSLVGSAIMIISYIAYLEEELKKSKEFLSSVINTIPDPVFVKDQNHRWIVLNHAFCRFIGYSLETLLEKSDYDFLPTNQAKQLWKQDDFTLKNGVEHESEEEFTNIHGTTYLIATKRSLHKDAAGNVFLVGVIRDITQRKRIEEELRRTAAELVRSNAELRQTEDRLRRMAYHDTLTGLPNRELFRERLTQALEWAQNHDQLIALLFLDLDGFKQINDSYGHEMGNLLLKAVAQRLIRCLRNSDTVARLGGDEFVVLLPAVPSIRDIQRVAEKILQTLCQNFILENQIILISTSIGVSIYPNDATDMDDLLKKADLAMYQAKGLGKNRYEFVQPEG